MKLIADGRTDHEIGRLLGLSEKTINHHVANIFGKLKARNRSNAVAIALSQQLISLESF
ncbi:MAG: response regulator transcription factor [Pyrinomonadaceae bacterium]